MFYQLYKLTMSLTTGKFQDKDQKSQNSLAGDGAEDSIMPSMNQTKKRPNHSTNEKKFDEETMEKSEKHVTPQNSNKGCWKDNKKCKIAMVIFAIFILISALSLFIFTLTYKPIVIQVGKSSQLQFGDGTALQVTTVTVQDRRIFGSNLKVNVIRSKQVSPKKDGRLLQEEKQNKGFTSTVNFEKQGIVAQVLPDLSTKIYVDIQRYTQYLLKTDPQAKRLLEQIDTKPSDHVCEKESTDEAKVIKCLEKALSDQLNGGSPVQLSPKTFLSFKYDQEKDQYVEEKQGNKTLRLLTGKKRLLFLGKIFKQAVNFVSTIVKPVIQLVKVAAPYIGAAVGGVIGFIGGGPQGAIAGAQLGFKIGTFAKDMLNSCFPDNTFRLRCDGKAELQKGISMFAGEFGFGGDSSKGLLGNLDKWMKF